jgi:SAM-dependent methyltransferase
MVDAALAKNAGDAATVNYLATDVRDMPAASRFDGAFSWHTSFGYEDESGHLDVLRAIRAQLKSGGRFAIDVTNRDFLVRNLRETIVYERGDNFLIERLSYDTKTSRMRNDRVYIRSGVRRMTFSLRLYGFTDLSDLLVRAGFGSVEPLPPEGAAAGVSPRIRLAARAV